LGTILLKISCELMLMMAILCCVYSYGMKIWEWESLLCLYFAVLWV